MPRGCGLLFRCCFFFLGGGGRVSGNNILTFLYYWLDEKCILGYFSFRMFKAS